MPKDRAPFDDSRNLALGLACLGLWAAMTVAQTWNHWPPDLSALYFAARFFEEGALAEIYASPPGFFGRDQPASWVAAVAASGHAGAQTFPYIYPPIWAALFAPIAANAGPEAFFNGVYLWHVALLAASPVLAYRIMRPAMGFALFAAISAVLLTTSVISLHALVQNQPQITVAFLTLLAFERLVSGRPVAAGVALGLAAAIKLTPVLLVAVLLAERQWRAAWATLATVSALALASLAVAGPDLHRIYVEQLRVISDQVLVWGINISLKSALFQISEVLGGQSIALSGNTALRLSAPDWLNVASALVLSGGAAFILAVTRPLPATQRLRNRLIAGNLLLTVCAPLAWAHHYVAPLLLLPGLVGPRHRPATFMLVALFGLAFANRSFAWLLSAVPAENDVLPYTVAAMLILCVAFAMRGRVSRTMSATSQPRRT